MKALILAGGLGTRISEESHLRPKPLIEIGGMPILWHIMKIYSSFNINDFIICCGYKGKMIKEFFYNYSLYTSDVTIDLRLQKLVIHRQTVEPWRITLLDTGENTMTGGRIRRAFPFLNEEDSFCVTYGDGVADVDIRKLIEYHQTHGKAATVTGVKAVNRFGTLDYTQDGLVGKFREKPSNSNSRINGGFFVFSRLLFDLLTSDETVLEQEPLETLADQGQLMMYSHDGFWQPMDTLREKVILDNLWKDGKAPWKLW